MLFHLQQYTPPPSKYLDSPMSSYRTCRHLWGLLMLASVSGCQVGNADVFSSGEGEILPLYWANLTTAVTVASMVSDPEGENMIMPDINWNQLRQTFYFSIYECPLFWEKRSRLWSELWLHTRLLNPVWGHSIGEYMLETTHVSYYRFKTLNVHVLLSPVTAVSTIR